MSQTYFIATPSGQRGPLPITSLLEQGLTPDMLVWTEGMAEWTAARNVPELASLLQGRSSAPFQPQPPPRAYSAPPGYPGAGISPSVGSDKRIAAGICGILLGSLGIHKFILGYTGTGVAMLLISLLTFGIGAAVMHIFGIIEGIIYLTKSDAEFAQTYVYGRKEWF